MAGQGYHDEALLWPHFLCLLSGETARFSGAHRKARLCSHLAWCVQRPRGLELCPGELLLLLQNEAGQMQHIIPDYELDGKTGEIGMKTAV